MAGMNDKDYYAILGVSKDADKREIQKAFQQKARKLHPDVNKAPDAEEKFKEVSEAYAVLSDDQKRARYDAMRSGNPFGSYGAPSAQGSYGGAGAARGSYYGGFSGFGGFPFGGMWNEPRRSARGSSQAFNPEEGADVIIDIELTPEQVKNGARKAVKYRRYESCSHCHGSGSVSSEHAHTCPSCGGTGYMDVDMSFLFGGGMFQMVCPECNGSGKVITDPCPSCGGSGREQVMSEAIIEFPAGTHDGGTVRVKGMGHAGTNGAAAGALIGRAHVAAERLEGKAQQGFRLMGLSAPFLLLALMGGTFTFFAALCLIPFCGGAIMVIREIPAHRSAIWFKRGLQVFANGLMNALFYALILMWFASCTRGMYYYPMLWW